MSVSRKSRFVITVVIAGFTLGVAATLLFQFLAQRKVGTTTNASRAESELKQASAALSRPAGPWGILEYQSIPLEPDEVFQDKIKQAEGATWYFANCSSQQVAELFGYCDLTRNQRQALFNSGWKDIPGGCAVTPPPEVVLGLSHRAVQRIYPVLEQSPNNFPPFRIPLDGFEAQFSDSGLSRDRIEIVRRLTYTNGIHLCFSAVAPIRTCFSQDEVKELVRALYRTPALSMRLRVDADSNICSLVNYWSGGRPAKAIRPLIESLARVPAGGRISVSYFFSAFARLKLYTYPDPDTDPAVFKEDCFYTALNFFSDVPDPKYMDRRNSMNALRADYSIVTNAPSFGDLVMLVDDSGTAIHICVFIADDTVFTKNGAGLLEPWVLMRIPDMLAEYPSEKPPRIVHLRKKASRPVY